MPISLPYRPDLGSPISRYPLSERRASVLNTPIGKLDTFEKIADFEYNFTRMGPADKLSNAVQGKHKDDALKQACRIHLDSFAKGQKYLEYTDEIWKAGFDARALLAVVDAGEREDLMRKASIESGRFVLTFPESGLRLSVPTDAIFDTGLQGEMVFGTPEAESRAWGGRLTSLEKEILRQVLHDAALKGDADSSLCLLRNLNPEERKAVLASPFVSDSGAVMVTLPSGGFRLPLVKDCFGSVGGAIKEEEAIVLLNALSNAQPMQPIDPKGSLGQICAEQAAEAVALAEDEWLLPASLSHDEKARLLMRASKYYLLLERDGDAALPCAEAAREFELSGQHAKAEDAYAQAAQLNVRAAKEFAEVDLFQAGTHWAAAAGCFKSLKRIEDAVSAYKQSAEALMAEAMRETALPHHAGRCFEIAAKIRFLMAENGEAAETWVHAAHAFVEANMHASAVEAARNAHSAYRLAGEYIKADLWLDIANRPAVPVEADGFEVM